SLYKIFFQPTPPVLALLCAWVTAEIWSAFLQRDRSHLVRTLFTDRVSKKEFRRLSDGTTAFDAEPKVYEVSVVVCDVATKFAFEKTSDPVAFAEGKGKLIRETTTHLIGEDAYLHAADGEGVVAFFGFPVPNAEHAQKTVRVVLEMLKNFRERRQGKGETSDK